MFHKINSCISVDDRFTCSCGLKDMLPLPEFKDFGGHNDSHLRDIYINRKETDLPVTVCPSCGIHWGCTAIDDGTELRVFDYTRFSKMVNEVTDYLTEDYAFDIRRDMEYTGYSMFARLTKEHKIILCYSLIFREYLAEESEENGEDTYFKLSDTFYITSLPLWELKKRYGGRFYRVNNHEGIETVLSRYDCL